ncbi:MAG: lipoyl synthase, partial [Acidobacteriota bacterium]
MEALPKSDETETTRQRKPPWIRVKLPSGETFGRLRTLMRSKSLHTVCEEAMCPNMAECWGCGTATFLILGDVCTRNCRFCAVKEGRPFGLDLDEPNGVADAVASMGLKHAVITSVTRDDLPDGGASHFAATIRAIRERSPECTVELLIPDLKGDLAALEIVLDARPDILGHNVETIPRLYPLARPQAVYKRSLDVLEAAKGM